MLLKKAEDKTSIMINNVSQKLLFPATVSQEIISV